MKVDEAAKRLVRLHPLNQRQAHKDVIQKILEEVAEEAKRIGRQEGYENGKQCKLLLLRNEASDEPPDFSRSALPRTMHLATFFRPLLVRRLRRISASWPFPDRVLVWMLPKLKKDVENFHSGNGKALAAMLKPSQLESLDRDLTALLLVGLDLIRPGLRKLLEDVVLGTG